MPRSAQHRTRVKMCGTTRLEDALAAVRFGIDGLGFIFYTKSPRYISVAEASEIIKELPPFVDRVGVFVNAPVEEVAAAAEAGLSCLQLHGKETLEYCREIRGRLPFCRIIKAFRVSEGSHADEFALYNDYVDAFLLDTYVSGSSGGTGKIFDWSIIDSLNLHRPIFLAGGLSPENIVKAITAVKPFAVDINSGVEIRPGIKDHLRLKEMMRLVTRTCSE